MTTPLIDFQQIRLDNDLEAVVEKYLGPPKNGKWRCPFHNDKTPSFSVKGDRYKCFGTCGAAGDVVDFVAAMEKINVKDAARKLGGYLLDLGLSQDQIRIKREELRVEYQRRQAERRREEQAKRESALKRIAGMMGRVETYHRQVDEARQYWYSQGLTDRTITRYRLGYCPKFPLWDKVDGEYRIVEYAPSCTIPYFRAGQLVSIRHRLIDRDKDKYRPEFNGLPNHLFNLDVIRLALEEIPCYLEQGELVLGEGEVKAMYATDIQLLPTVGIPGVETWQEDWLSYFAGLAQVYVILDPDADEKARSITASLNGNGIPARQVALSCKLDDFFWRNGGTIADFMRIIEQGRRVV